MRVYTDELVTLATVYSNGTTGAALTQPLIPNAGGQTTLTTALLTTDTTAIVADVSTFSAGQRVRFYDGTNRVWRTITSINSGAKTLTLDSAVGVAFAIANTVVNGPGMRGVVAFWVDDGNDYYVAVLHVATGEIVHWTHIPIRAPSSPINVQEEGTLVNNRGTVNFIGRSVTAVDNPGAGRVDVTVGIGGTEAAPSPEVIGDTPTGLWGEGGGMLSVVGGGKRVVRFFGGPTQVNYLDVYGAATGQPITTRSAGSDATIGMTIDSKGATSSLILRPGSLTALNIVGVASAVNYLKVTNAATGGGVTLEAAGSDANINISLSGKGSGGDINLGAHLSDYLQVTTGGAGFARVWAVGAGADSSIQLSSKGAGAIDLFSGMVGRYIARFLDAASAVNYLTVMPAGTGGAPQVASAGSDATVHLVIDPKGAASSVRIRPGGLDALTAQGVASAVNYLTVTNAATVGGPSIAAAGSDASIVLHLQSKGAGGGVYLDSLKTDYGYVAGGTGTWSFNAVGGSANVSINLVPKGTGTLQYNGVQVGTVANRTEAKVSVSSAAVTWTTAFASTPVVTCAATAGGQTCEIPTRSTTGATPSGAGAGDRLIMAQVVT